MSGIGTPPVTLITGGAGGIGAATTRTLLKAGHRLVVTGRNADALDRFAAQLDAGDHLVAVPGDATDYESVLTAVRAAEQRFGRLDNVIANAGFSTQDGFTDGDPEQWRAMVLTNVLGPALLVKAALPALVATGGRVVLIGSVAGFKNTPGNMYSVTKTAVTALAENLRMLVTRDGVGVTLVAPGRVDTPFWTRGEHTGPPDGPILEPQSVADVVAFALTQPAGVDINTMLVRPVGQAV